MRFLSSLLVIACFNILRNQFIEPGQGRDND